MNENDNEDTDDDGTRWLAHRQQKVSYPSLAKVGRKPRQSERNDAIELGFNVFKNAMSLKNNAAQEEEEDGKKKTSRPFNRVNDEEWLNDENKKGDNKFRNAGFGKKNIGFKAEQKFVAKQGKKFAHEKNKEKKRRVYRGGKIDENAVNSKVLFDSDDE